MLDGLEPNDEEHVSYVVYEPTSGSIIHNAKRLQVFSRFDKFFDHFFEIELNLIFLYHWLNLSRFSDLNDVVYLNRKPFFSSLYNLE